jgi:uncharacterized repeat protein (TIGR01451 family)
MFFANYIEDENVMDEYYEYNLRFTADGRSGHYYIERYNVTQDARINVKYTTSSNTLEVDCTNIKVLSIYCREMYEKKSEEVFKYDPNLDTNFYKTYFIDRNHFHVHVDSEKIIDELKFIDTPTPYNVTVNGKEWWLSGINYTYEDNGIILTKVPAGKSNVDIYFKSNDKNAPIAKINVDKTVVSIGENIFFNGSLSSDPDGQISKHVWDFGDGSYKGGKTKFHSYQTEGNYTVILTVTDNDDLIDSAFSEIRVVKDVMSISKTVDKEIATQGSTLKYTIKLNIDESWTQGVKDITVTDALPPEIEYIDASPLPVFSKNTLTWKFNVIFDNDELSNITIRTIVKEDVSNDTEIVNFALLNYNGVNDKIFPQVSSNVVKTIINIDNIEAPRIKMRVPDITLKEDAPTVNIYLSSYEFDLQDSNTDLDWYITGNDESLYLISGEYSDFDTISITPLPDMYGDSLVTLWLEDSEENTANQPLWINITSVNDPPRFAKAPDLFVHYNDPYTFNYEPYLSDIDSQLSALSLFVDENISEDLTIDSSTDGATVESFSKYLMINGFSVTYFFPDTLVGDKIYIPLMVSDGFDYDSDIVQITVTDDYTPKLKADLPNVVLREGEKKINIFNLNDYFEDPDGDSLFYTIGETYITVEINENNTVDISSPTDWNGYDTVTFRARDPIGAIAEDTILVTVLPVNDPPKIDGVPELFVVRYDADYRFDLSPYVTDSDNNIYDLYLIIKDPNIRTDHLNPLLIIMNYPKSMVGMEFPVTLSVSDGTDTASEVFMVKVSPNWPPEIINKLSDLSFNEDESIINAFNLNDYFSDKDDEPLFYSYGQKNVIVEINENGAVSFNSSMNWFGTEIVTFRATDPSNAFIESVITVSVLPVNDPPILKSLPNQTGIATEMWRMDLTGYIIDIDNKINEMIISIESEKIEIVISGRELVFYSEKPLTEEVIISISDGTLETSQPMLVQIDALKSTPDTSNVFLTSIIWMLILVISLIIVISSYVSYLRYVGKYDIEEIYWIHNSGILILQNRMENINHNADSDIVSSMLKGIMDFTQDAFSDQDQNNKIWKIKEIQMGGKNILIERGKYTFLATVFTGKSGKKLYSHSRMVLNSIEQKFDYGLRSFDGKVEKFYGASEFMKTFLPSGIVGS